MSFKRENGADKINLGFDVRPATYKFICEYAKYAKPTEIAKGKALDLIIEEFQILQDTIERLRRPQATSGTPQNQASFRF